jgi:polyferredoxin
MISTTDENLMSSSCWTGLCHRREREKERKKERKSWSWVVVVLLLLLLLLLLKKRGAKRMTLMSSLKNRLKITNFFLIFWILIALLSALPKTFM